MKMFVRMLGDVGESDKKRRLVRGVALALVAMAMTIEVGFESPSVEARPVDRAPSALALVDYVGVGTSAPASPVRADAASTDRITNCDLRSFNYLDAIAAEHAHETDRLGSRIPKLEPVPAPFVFMPPLGVADIEAMTSRHAGAIANCWRRSHTGAEEIVLADVRRVTAVLAIGEAGGVTSVYYKGLPPDTKLERCLTRSIKTTWKFRPNPGARLGFQMEPPPEGTR